MRSKILYILVAIALLSTAGGFYVYLSRADEEPVKEAEHGNIHGEHVDEAAITPEPTTFINDGTAPEFAGLSNWMNAEKPLTVSELRGKVVLVHFWTYSCIDCTRALPFISKWHNTYKDHGLVVVGIHTPQYNFEKVGGNVTNAVNGFKIPYAIAQDNDYKTWGAYHNQFWPSLYVIDQSGNIVYDQLGGGKFGQTEKAIRTLLGMEDDFEIPAPPPEGNANQTQNMYVGSTKIGASFGGSEKLSNNEQIFVFPKKLGANKIGLEGFWKQDQESLIHTKGYGRLLVNFNAAQLTMVAGSPDPVTIKVYVDDVLIKGVVVKEQGEYQLFDSLTPGAHTLRLEIPDATVQIFNFLFS